MTTEFPFDSLPNRFDFTEAQPRIYSWWEEQGYFHAEPDPQRQPYTIVIPPPNVTGALHLGHALNNSLQDIVVRFRRMQGCNTLWIGRWRHNLGDHRQRPWRRRTAVHGETPRIIPVRLLAPTDRLSNVDGALPRSRKEVPCFELS